MAAQKKCLSLRRYLFSLIMNKTKKNSYRSLTEKKSTPPFFIKFLNFFKSDLKINNMLSYSFSLREIGFGYFFANVLLFLSCGNSHVIESDVKEIPVDFSQKVISFPLSELAEDITAIELELTNESMLKQGGDVFIYDNNLIIVQNHGIFLFEMNGKFVRTIGSKGQGPGEYLSNNIVTVDEEKNRLYVYSRGKIICYDLIGKNYITESTLIQSKKIDIIDMNYINNELLIIGSCFIQDEKGHHQHLAIYRLNDELQITDSCAIRDDYTNLFFTIDNSFGINLYKTDSTVYFYYPKNNFDTDPDKKVLLDILYRYENNQLIPDIKLNIKNRMRWSSDEDFYLYNIHKTSRYVFVAYNMYYAFCYDMKTGLNYNVLIFEPQQGSSYMSRNGDLIENAKGGDQRRSISAVNNNPNLFYYLHTNMDPDVLEEPNPTLYLINLKK